MKGSIILFVASYFISKIHSSLFDLSDEGNTENPLDENFLDFTPIDHIVDDGSIVESPFLSDSMLWQDDDPNLKLDVPLQSPDDVHATDTIAFYRKYSTFFPQPAISNQQPATSYNAVLTYAHAPKKKPFRGTPIYATPAKNRSAAIRNRNTHSIGFS